MSPVESRARLAWVDALRGLALLGMVAYHGAWDLHAFGFTAVDPRSQTAWAWLGHGVAALFLALSGLGLSLAARQGASRYRRLARLGRIAAAAALVSVVTWVATPDAPVWFGILHCLVATNLIALALAAAPTPILLVVAVAAAAAPVLLPGWDNSGWVWTGLGKVTPATLDFRPVLPWLAPVLLGTALGRSIPLRQSRDPAETAPGWRQLAWAGRHSLGLYLIHQPILFAILAMIAGGLPHLDSAADILRQPDQASAFLRHCRSECEAGADRERCISTCHCVLTTIVAGRATPASSWQMRIGRSATIVETALAVCRQDPLATLR